MIRITRTNYVRTETQLIPDRKLYCHSSENALYPTISDRPFFTAETILAQTPFEGTLEIAYEEAAC